MATSQDFRKPRGAKSRSRAGIHPFEPWSISDDETRREVHLPVASSREPAGIARFIPGGQGGGLQTAGYKLPLEKHQVAVGEL